MAVLNTSETKFVWRRGYAEAAVLVAEDDLTNEKIAESCGISVTTLWRIRQRPEFQERVQEHVAAFQAAMLRHAIAKRHKRVATLDRLHEKALAVIEQRAEQMKDNAPGVNTGLMVKSFKQIGAGPDAYAVEEYTVDTALLREIRAIEEQAAKELGQWEEKQAITGDVMVRRYIGVDVEQV
jgi:hypothetical protein